MPNKKQLREEMAEVLGLRDGYCDGRHPKFGCDFERLNFIEDKFSATLKEIEGKAVALKKDVIEYSKNLPPIAKSNRRKNIMRVVVRNKAIDEVLSLLAEYRK